MVTVKRILKAINNPLLSLYRVPSDKGLYTAEYFYFAYDDEPSNIFETHSVYVCRLNDLRLEDWIDIGNDFLNVVEKLKDARSR